MPTIQYHFPPSSRVYRSEAIWSLSYCFLFFFLSNFLQMAQNLACGRLFIKLVTCVPSPYASYKKISTKTYLISKRERNIVKYPFIKLKNCVERWILIV